MDGLKIVDKVKDDDLLIKKGFLIIDRGNDIKESKKIGDKTVGGGDCYVAGLNRMEGIRETETKRKYL